MVPQARRIERGLLAALLCGTLACVSGQRTSHEPGAAYEVYAVRYGTLSQFSVASLVTGADPARRMDIALMVWLIRGGANDRMILVDAGFYRDKFMTRWKPLDYVLPSKAVERLGVTADQITDIVVSHVHWDHLDGADLFPNARIWIQRAEYDYYVDSAGRPRRNTIDSLDARMLADLRDAGRVNLVDGDRSRLFRAFGCSPAVSTRSRRNTQPSRPRQAPSSSRLTMPTCMRTSSSAVRLRKRWTP